MCGKTGWRHGGAGLYVPYDVEQVPHGRVVSKPLQGKSKEAHGIADAKLCGGGHYRKLYHLLARLGEGKQVAGKISAVNGRDVFRFECLQFPGFVPVVKVSVETGEFLQRRQCVFQPVRCSGQADPAEIACGDDREKIEAKIGRGTAVSDDRMRLFLKIVGGEPVIRGGHEGGEESPGPPSDQTEERHVFRWQDLDRFGRGGQADLTRNEGRDEPE